MNLMRTIIAVFLSAVPVAVIAIVLIPWMDSGVPFERDGRQIALAPFWLAIIIAAVFICHVVSGVVAKSMDRSGNALYLLLGFELISRSIKFIAKLVISPREVPDGLDLATAEFRSAWPYLQIPPWYILAYGMLAIIGLYLGGVIAQRRAEMLTNA